MAPAGASAISGPQMKRWGGLRVASMATVATVAIATACKPTGAGPADDPPSPPALSSSATAPAAPAVAPSAEASETPEASDSAPGPVVPDLAADVERRKAMAATLFSPAPRVVVVDGLFVVVAAQPAAPLDAAVDRIHRAVSFLYSGPLDVRPSAAVTVFLFADNETYRHFAQTQYRVDARKLWGFYLRGSRREIVVFGKEGLDTLNHELTHPLLQAWFSTGAGGAARIPMWADECVAAYYEAPTFPPDGSVHGQPTNWRQPTLRAALRSSEPPRLEPFFGMSDDAFEGKARPDPDMNVDADVARPIELLHYAEARSLCAWLDGQGKLWPFMHSWKAGFATDPTGEKAFASVLGGQTPAQATDTWRRWANRD